MPEYISTSFSHLNPYYYKWWHTYNYIILIIVYYVCISFYNEFLIQAWLVYLHGIVQIIVWDIV